MKKRKLGKTNIELSVMGIGTWAAGGGNWAYSWGPQDDNETIKAISKGFDLGINWIDTAPVYGLGHAEEVTGKAIEKERKKIILSTKCGISWPEEKGEPFVNLKPDFLRIEIENSMRRLNTDYFDMYMIHNPAIDFELDAAWETVQKFKKEGKIITAGISNMSYEQLKRVNDAALVDFIQPPYNLVNRSIEKEILPFAKENNIGVVTYGPMARGILTGKYTKEKIEALPDDDHRKHDESFRGESLKNALDIVSKLKLVADARGVEPGQAAIAWVLSHFEITSAITGIRSEAQINQSIKAAEIELTEIEKQQIEQ